MIKDEELQEIHPIQEILMNQTKDEEHNGGPLQERKEGEKLGGLEGSFIFGGGEIFLRVLCIVDQHNEIFLVEERKLMVEKKTNMNYLYINININ